MKHCVGLPWKPGLHLYPRVVHEPKVEDVDEDCHVHQPMDGEQEQRGYEETIVEDQLKWTHGYHRVGSRRVVSGWMKGWRHDADRFMHAYVITYKDFP